MVAKRVFARAARSFSRGLPPDAVKDRIKGVRWAETDRGLSVDWTATATVEYLGRSSTVRPTHLITTTQTKTATLMTARARGNRAGRHSKDGDQGSGHDRSRDRADRKAHKRNFVRLRTQCR